MLSWLSQIRYNLRPLYLRQMSTPTWVCDVPNLLQYSPLHRSGLNKGCQCIHSLGLNLDPQPPVDGDSLDLSESSDPKTTGAECRFQGWRMSYESMKMNAEIGKNIASLRLYRVALRVILLHVPNFCSNNLYVSVPENVCENN